eukprot:6212760-Pleurochrysis_carterae.AAC.5
MIAHQGSRRTLTSTPHRQWVASSTGLLASHFAHPILSERGLRRRRMLASRDQRMRYDHGRACMPPSACPTRLRMDGVELRALEVRRGAH